MEINLVLESSSKNRKFVNSVILSSSNVLLGFQNRFTLNPHIFPYESMGEELFYNINL